MDIEKEDMRYLPYDLLFPERSRNVPCPQKKFSYHLQVALRPLRVDKAA
jgi:hypothetical protein